MDHQLNILDIVNANSDKKSNFSIPQSWIEEEEKKKKKAQEVKKNLSKPSKQNTSPSDKTFKFPIYVSFFTMDKLYYPDDFGGEAAVSAEQVRLKLATDYKAFRIKKQVVWAEESLTKALKKSLDDSDPMKVANTILYFTIKGSTKGAIRITHQDDMVKLNSNNGPAYVFGQDGNYRIEQNRLGVFSVRTKEIPDLPIISEFFHFSLPKIPFRLLISIIQSFYSVYKRLNSEAAAHILYDLQNKRYVIEYPVQSVYETNVRYSRNIRSSKQFITVLDIHSHHTMKVNFSSMDDRDEINGQLYMIVKNMQLDNKVLTFELGCRFGLNGDFLTIDPISIFDHIQHNIEITDDHNSLIYKSIVNY